MSNPFIAEIRIFGFGFAPRGWAFCNGQILPVSQNTALFSLLGTAYGGDGKSTFALPDLQDNAPMHPGQGPGLSLHDLGETGGYSTVMLVESEIPFHTHNLIASQGDGNDTSPKDELFASGIGVSAFVPNPPANKIVQLAPSALPPQGNSFPHNNMMPFLVLNFCIALVGIFPQRP
jgi:microcystin-dependent protein